MLGIIRDVIREPMFLLLLVACFLYFILGEISEGILMLIALLLVAAISLYQEVKSANAINALGVLFQPKVIAVRNGKEVLVPAEELVPNDVIMLEEGMYVPADGIVIRSNDLTVDESIMTGESMPAEKGVALEKNILFQGSTVNSGKCFARITATGNNTRLGKLGKTVATHASPKTLLQVQMNLFIKRLAAFGIAGFLIIFLVNFFNGEGWSMSLIFALTVAMSAVPEEIPVALASFMALGAYKMSRHGIISRQPQIIENVGAVSVVCLDKTGTITENKMSVKSIYSFLHHKLEQSDDTPDNYKNTLLYATLASEQMPFDAMEKAIHEKFNSCITDELEAYKMVHEYPLEGRPPMMTHVYKNGSSLIIAGKGATERILKICKLDLAEIESIMNQTKQLAMQGFRVLGVASAVHQHEVFPENQDDFNWKFEGLVVLYDPPKETAAAMIKSLTDAHIQIMLLTGDFPETALNIASQVGFKTNGYLTGVQVMSMEEDELQKNLRSINICARMFPEAKLRVVESLQAMGEIVAMTGDGVNDGPALKAANIGIAMGKRGTELAREAADLVLTDDNPNKISIAVIEGRKIFSNLRKAIRYIISIHIPIILTASLPLILGWVYPNIFSPVHIIFLELIMGPTCSIFYEREPVEKNTMLQYPRARDRGLFARNELMISVTQGLVISAGTLGLYYFFSKTGAGIDITRTIVFTTLILSNLFLTFVNRSFSENIFTTLAYKNSLALVVVAATITFLICLHFVPFIRNLFQLVPITAAQFGLSILVAFLSVIWFEIYKVARAAIPETIK